MSAALRVGAALGGMAHGVFVPGRLTHKSTSPEPTQRAKPAP